MDGTAAQCAVCGEPATMFVNTTAAMASSVPSMMGPRCFKHAPRVPNPDPALNAAQRADFPSPAPTPAPDRGHPFVPQALNPHYCAYQYPGNGTTIPFLYCDRAVEDHASAAIQAIHDTRWRTLLRLLEEREAALRAAEAGRSNDEQRWRELLWLRHGHKALYGDDGEMQCSQCHTDFKRASLDTIEAHMFETGLAEYREWSEARRAALGAGADAAGAVIDMERPCSWCRHTLGRHTGVEGMCLDCKCAGWTPADA